MKHGRQVVTENFWAQRQSKLKLWIPAGFVFMFFFYLSFGFVVRRFDTWNNLPIDFLFNDFAASTFPASRNFVAINHLSHRQKTALAFVTFHVGTTRRKSLLQSLVICAHVATSRDKQWEAQCCGQTSNMETQEDCANAACRKDFK